MDSQAVVDVVGRFPAGKGSVVVWVEDHYPAVKTIRPRGDIMSAVLYERCCGALSNQLFPPCFLLIPDQAAWPLGANPLFGCRAEDAAASLNEGEIKHNARDRATSDLGPDHRSENIAWANLRNGNAGGGLGRYALLVPWYLDLIREVTRSCFLVKFHEFVKLV